MNPDGTHQMTFYGNMHPNNVYIDAKPIPNSEKIVASFSWGHGSTEHAGSIGIIDPRQGPDEKSAMKKISKGKNYRDPWAFSETAFLAATGTRLILMNGEGNEQTFLDLPQEWKENKLTVHEPRPVIKRTPERAVSDMTDSTAKTGKLLLSDVYQGRNMVGVQRGEIKKLLILETLAKPINYTGGMEPLSWGGTFTLERIIGTVPVEADGSANFELPAGRSFFFVALDEKDLSVKRMQSFLSVMPGETNSCIGCHEERTATPPRYAGFPIAFKRAPSPITPVADFRGVDGLGNKLAVSTGIPDVIDFPRDVQPIFDARCVSCHSPDKREGGVSLVGHRTPFYSISYATLTAKTLVADGRNLPQSNYAPRTIGSGASRLLKFTDGTHYDVKLTEREQKVLRLWIETGAAYPGTYAGLGSGMLGGYAENKQDVQDLQWPETQAMKDTLLQNCASCHTSKQKMRLPYAFSDETDMTWWIIKRNDRRQKFSRQLVFDLTVPEKSTILLAPLAKSAGGYESCGSAIFQDKNDPRCQTILAAIERGKAHLGSVKRFDMPGFIPRPQYIRELKKYGILPKEHAAATPVDTYALEQQYWRSLWYKPQ
jgi:mono/diheme cytochrome c family protein